MTDASLSHCRANQGGRSRGGTAVRYRCLVVVCLFLILFSRGAAADGLFTGSAGVSFANDQSEQVGTWGLSLAGMAGGVFGFELDFGRTGEAKTESVFVGDSRTTTVMGNVIVGVPLGAVRPYLVGGVGWVRTELGVSTGSDLTDDGLGVDFGGGLMGFFGDHIGARADLRYFRAVSAGDNFLDFDFKSLRFVRFTGGVVLRF